MKNNRILIMAGGTGGHVIPALSVAKEFQQQGCHVEWLGTANGIEAHLVPQADISLHTIPISGLRGKRLLKWFVAPFFIMTAIMMARRFMKQYKPAVVLGMGGFASGPGGVAAWLLGIPLVIHEQNALAGLTNNCLKRLSRKVLYAFPNTFPNKENYFLVGNPIRKKIINVAAPEQRFWQRYKSKKIRLLILGGSRGAKSINDLMPMVIEHLTSEKVEVWHQTGQASWDSTWQAYHQRGLSVRVEPFIDDMASAYAWADLVISRSGALTVTELAAVGVGSLLIPFPYAVDNHQYYNALFLADVSAAMIILQQELSTIKLCELITACHHPATIEKMAVAARQLRQTDSTEQVVSHCLEYLHE